MSIKIKKVTMLFAVVIMFLLIASPKISDSATAEDSTVLIVKSGSTVVKEYTMDDIEGIQTAEGEKTYNYSRYNASANHSNITGVTGPTVVGILSDAGINLNNENTVKFISGDDYSAYLTGEQLTENRYYFPNGENGTANGVAGNDASRANKELMPAVINTNFDAVDSSKGTSINSTTLCVGQVSPNEQTAPIFNKNMLGKNGVAGQIIVEPSTASQINNDLKLDGESTFFVPHDSVKFKSESDLLNSKTIYYTLDGSTPTKNSDIYNYKTSGGLANAVITADAKPGVHNIKLLVTKFGEKDSRIVTLKYYIGEISVYEDDTLITTISALELKNLTESKTYDYTGYNTVGTFRDEEYARDTQGPTIESIISEAGIELSNVDDDQLIILTSNDGYDKTLTKKQLTADRFYFPNGNNGTEKGSKGNSASINGREEAPAIVDMNSGRFFIGQEHPNEQNYPLFVKMFADRGKIEISSDKAEKAEKPTITPEKKTLVWGNAIDIRANQSKDGKIYYTTTGNNPSVSSDIYNYDTYNAPIGTRNINVPAGSNIYKVKAYVIEYGKLDSDIAEVEYPTIPTKVTDVKVKSSNYKSLKISWSKKTGADGYIVYRANTKKGKYSKVKTVNNASTTSYNNSGLKTGKTYYYKIVAYKGSTSRVSADSDSAFGKPVLAKPTAVKAKTKGSKKIKITCKKVSGASGYVVYRSTKKKSGFKAVKTVKSSKKLNFTNKKLKKGKKYYYKIKAYRNVSGKKVYSSYSKVVSRKAK